MPVRARLSAQEQKIHDLICRRLLMAWHDEHIWAVTTLITAISSRQADGAPLIDRYHSSGTAVEQIGWKVLEASGDRPAAKSAAATARKAKAANAAETAETAETADAEQALPAGLKVGQVQNVREVRALLKQTRPPPRLTEAALLTAMETAGKQLEDKELSAAMKERGLGTPATRAEIIETLLKRQYLTRDGKALQATERGLRLIAAVQPPIKSPAMTGEWEARLKRIQRGEDNLADFMAGIAEFVAQAVAAAFMLPRPAAPAALPVPSAQAAPRREPVPATQLETLLRSVFRLCLLYTSDAADE